MPSTADVDAEGAFVARMAAGDISWRWYVADGALESGSASALTQRGVVARPAQALHLVLEAAHKCGIDLVVPDEGSGRVCWQPRIDQLADAALHPDAVPAALGSATRALRVTRPTLTVTGRTMPFAEVARVAGTDALVWHLLAHDGRAPVPVVTPVDVLASRRDDNPLALLRRAHAACARRIDTMLSIDSHDPRPAHALTAHLALGGQVVRDLRRTGRLKPVLRHLESIAVEALAHLERTTVTRTDARAVAVARRVLADALAAAGLAAPVPY